MNRSFNSLNDILESMNRINTYISGVDYESFLNNQMLIDAVIRNLEIIGEAARNLSDELRKKHPELPLRNMIGLRNILIHQYFGVDESIIWEVITVDLPDARPNLIKVIQAEMDT
jgi:uncharacterized protein with HEPN domain